MPLGGVRTITATWTRPSATTSGNTVPSNASISYDYTDSHNTGTTSTNNTRLVLTSTNGQVPAYVAYDATTQPQPVQYTANVLARGSTAGGVAYLRSSQAVARVGINYPPMFVNSSGTELREIDAGNIGVRATGTNDVDIDGILVADETAGTLSLAVTGDMPSASGLAWRLVDVSTNSGGQRVATVRASRPTAGWQAGQTYSANVTATDEFNASSRNDLAVKFTMVRDDDNPPRIRDNIEFPVEPGGSVETRLYDGTSDAIITDPDPGDSISSIGIHNPNPRGATLGSLVLTGSEAANTHVKITLVHALRVPRAVPDSILVEAGTSASPNNSYGFRIFVQDTTPPQHQTNSSGWTVKVNESTRTLNPPSNFSLSYT